MQDRTFTVIGFTDSTQSHDFLGKMMSVELIFSPEIVAANATEGSIKILFADTLTFRAIGKELPGELRHPTAPFDTVLLLNERAVRVAQKAGLDLPVVATFVPSDEVLNACGTLLDV